MPTLTEAARSASAAVRSHAGIGRGDSGLPRSSVSLSGTLMGSQQADKSSQAHVCRVGELDIVRADTFLRAGARGEHMFLTVGSWRDRHASVLCSSSGS